MYEICFNVIISFNTFILIVQVGSKTLTKQRYCFLFKFFLLMVLYIVVTKGVNYSFVSPDLSIRRQGRIYSIQIMVKFATNENRGI